MKSERSELSFCIIYPGQQLTVEVLELVLFKNKSWEVATQTCVADAFEGGPPLHQRKVIQLISYSLTLYILLNIITVSFSSHLQVDWVHPRSCDHTNYSIVL